MLGHLSFELEIIWQSTYASDKVYQLLAHGRWFSLDTPAFSTTKAGRHDIAEILLKVALNTKNPNKKSEYIIFDWQITLYQFISWNNLTSIVTIWKTQHSYTVSIIL